MDNSEAMQGRGQVEEQRCYETAFTNDAHAGPSSQYSQLQPGPSQRGPQDATRHNPESLQAPRYHDNHIQPDPSTSAPRLDWILQCRPAYPLPAPIVNILPMNTGTNYAHNITNNWCLNGTDTSMSTSSRGDTRLNPRGGPSQAPLHPNPYATGFQPSKWPLTSDHIETSASYAYNRRPTCSSIGTGQGLPQAPHMTDNSSYDAQPAHGLYPGAVGGMRIKRPSTSVSSGLARTSMSSSLARVVALFVHRLFST